MKRVRISSRASKDLLEIHKYYAREAGERFAMSLITKLLEQADALAQFPGMGRSCEELRAGWRVLPARKHMLYYREMDGGIELSRVIDGRRNQKQALR